MAWWDIWLNKAKKTVSKVTDTVSSIYNSIKETVSKTISKVKEKVDKVKETVKKSVAKTISKVKEKVDKVKETTKKEAEKKVEKAKEKTEKAEKAETPFQKRWKSLISNLKGRDWISSLKDFTALWGASIFPQDVKVVAQPVAIGLPGAPGTLIVAEKVGVFSKIAKLAKGAVKALALDFRKRPLLTILLGVFAVTEVPNYFNMRIFARDSIAESAGEAPSQVTFPLNTQDSHFKSLQFSLGTAIKNEDWESANSIIEDMEETRDNFKKIMDEKKATLEKIGLWDVEVVNLAYFDDIIKRAKEEIAPNIEALKMDLQEEIEGRVREIVDGDTIRLRWGKGDVTLDVRLVGINSPEKGEEGAKESTEWLSRKIFGRDVKMLVDPEHKRGIYNRVLGTIYFGGENINLGSVKEGWSFFYPVEKNKYVDELVYADAEKKAKEERKGVWGLLEETGSLGASSSPTHAKIFLDGEDTGLRTAETIKDVPVGKHTIRIELEGYEAYEEEVLIKFEEKREVFSKLKKLAETLLLENEVEETVTIEEAEPVKEEEIPKEYTEEQKWALTEAFNKIWELTKGSAIMSEEERGNLVNSFALYTEGQKNVLNLLFRDIVVLTRGREQLSTDEYDNLVIKYHMLKEE